MFDYSKEIMNLIEAIYSDAAFEGEEGFIAEMYTQVDDLDELAKYLSSSYGLEADECNNLVVETLNTFDMYKDTLYESIQKYIDEDLEDYFTLRGMEEYYNPEEFSDYNLDNLNDIGRFIIGLILLKDPVEGLKYSAFLLTVVIEF